MWKPWWNYNQKLRRSRWDSKLTKTHITILGQPTIKCLIMGMLLNTLPKSVLPNIYADLTSWQVLTRKTCSIASPMLKFRTYVHIWQILQLWQPDFHISSHQSLRSSNIVSQSSRILQNLTGLKKTVIQTQLFKFIVGEDMGWELVNPVWVWKDEFANTFS